MNESKTNKIKGVIYVCIAGICWGIIGVFTRRLSKGGLSSIQITAVRNLFATIIMLMVILMTGRDKIKIKLRDIWMFVGTGVISIALFNMCYFKALELTTMNVASILLYLAPALVMIMSVFFFKEKITLKKILSLIMAFTGCVLTTGIIGSLVGGTQNVVPFIAIAAGVGSGFFYALYSIFGKVALKKYDTMTITFYSFLLATVGVIFFSNPSEIVMVMDADKRLVFIGMLLALISTVVPFLCYTTGLKYLEPGHASVMAFLEPMVAGICGIVLFNEVLTTENALGIIFIFLSVVLLNIGGNSKTSDKNV